MRTTPRPKHFFEAEAEATMYEAEARKSEDESEAEAECFTSLPEIHQTLFKRSRLIVFF